jgi:hypothetical protein
MVTEMHTEMLEQLSRYDATEFGQPKPYVSSRLRESGNKISQEKFVGLS